MVDPHPLTTLVVESAGLTDVGRRRTHNEDAIFVAPDLGLYVVCDGVGGHAKGDVASALAIETLEDIFRDEHGIEDPPPGHEHLAPAAQLLVAAVCEANLQVYAEGEELPQSQSMGSTVVAVFTATGMLHICHVGDSRCYRFRDDRLEQLTRDHNVRNDAMRLDPSLSEEALDELPSHVVTRALGHDVEVEPDVCSVAPQVDDLYLLCSDGLCGLVPDEQVRDLLEYLGDDLGLACEELVAMANAAGGKDNISVILLRVRGVEEALDAAPKIELPPCVWCGARWDADMSFCVSCGRAPLDDEEPEAIEVSCTECSAVLLPDTRFCHECGAPHGLYD